MLLLTAVTTQTAPQVNHVQDLFDLSSKAEFKEDSGFRFSKVRLGHLCLQLSVVSELYEVETERQEPQLHPSFLCCSCEKQK